MIKIMRMTNHEKGYRAMPQRSNEGAQGAKGHPVKYTIIITERNTGHRSRQGHDRTPEAAGLYEQAKKEPLVTVVEK